MVPLFLLYLNSLTASQNTDFLSPCPCIINPCESVLSIEMSYLILSLGVGANMSWLVGVTRSEMTNASTGVRREGCRHEAQTSQCSRGYRSHTRPATWEIGFPCMPSTHSRLSGREKTQSTVVITITSSFQQMGQKDSHTVGAPLMSSQAGSLNVFYFSWQLLNHT